MTTNVNGSRPARISADYHNRKTDYLLQMPAQSSFCTLRGRRSPCLQRLAIRRQLHLGRHHLAVQGNIKDLFAVLIPPDLRSTVGRDLKLPARSWKRLDINLKPSRFVRLVRDPLAVGGELAIAFLKRSLQERKGLFIAGDRQNPQVIARAVRLISLPSDASS